jgi:predicted O-methyltransferase YrrM
VISPHVVTDRIGQTLHRAFKSPKETARLLAAADPGLRAVAQALSAAWRLSPASEERVWFGKIEALRRMLEGSEEEITLVDYGAGSAHEGRSPDQMRQGMQLRRKVCDICRAAAKPREWAELLFFLVRSLRPSACLELGTSLGISAAYQAAALELNGVGRLVTIEGAEPVADLARKHLRELGLSRAKVEVGRFQDRLDAVLRDLGSVDYAFIDGHHDEAATAAYFEQVLPSLSERAVVVFDDIAWSAGMKRAWRRIGDHERIVATVDLFKIGICVVGGSAGASQRFKIAFA